MTGYARRRSAVQRAATKCYRDDPSPAVYRPGSGATQYEVANYIFRDENRTVGLGLEEEVSTQSPEIDFRLADLAVEPAVGGYWYIPRRARWYEIIDRQPDGEGMEKHLLVTSAVPSSLLS